MIIANAKDCLFRCLRNKADGDRVLKDAGAVEELVRGSPYRRANHGLAGLSGQHAISPQDNEDGEDATAQSSFSPSCSTIRFSSAICFKAKSW